MPSEIETLQQRRLARKKEMDKAERTGAKKKKKKKNNPREDWVKAPSRAAFFLRAQIMLIVLLHMVHINSIPSAVIRAQLPHQWWNASITCGVLCSAFFFSQQQQQWRDGAQRPTQLFSLTCTTTLLPSSSPLLPPHPSLSHSNRDMPPILS